MITLATKVREEEQEWKETDRQIEYVPWSGDFGHLLVCRKRLNGMRETIGHIYTEIYGDEYRYVSTNKSGREIFPDAGDFATIDLQFERYARTLARIERGEHFEPDYHQLYLKTNNKMKTQPTNSERPKKFNQLVFVEYEKPTKDGHFITILDSYKNTIGKIHKSYNAETKKYEYTAFDHAGTPVGTSEKLWELKGDFVKNREVLLEQAHQRRIDGSERALQPTEQNAQLGTSDSRKKETEKVRESKKSPEQKQEKSERSTATKSNAKVADKGNDATPKPMPEIEDEDIGDMSTREQELDDIRDDKGRDEQSFER